MFKIEKMNNKITLTRGDHADLKVLLSDELGDTYEMKKGDYLTFTMKKNIYDKTISLKKTTFDTPVINFVKADTNELSFGEYIYDIQLTTADEEVFTVIPPSIFVVGEEITE